MAPRSQKSDVVIVGAGLSGTLTALALGQARRDLRVVLIDQAARPLGNHTWCCHVSDIREAQPEGQKAWDWFAPFVEQRWDNYDLHFPAYARTVNLSYAAVRSDHLWATAARHLPPVHLRLGQNVTELKAGVVALANGDKIEAPVILDARGEERPQNNDCPGPAKSGNGFQKFVGRQIRIAPTVTPIRPVLMDARGPQDDGFHFIYALPFSQEQILVEDTHFCRTPVLDVARLNANIDAYIAGRGWQVLQVEREEQGVLPMPWRKQHDPFSLVNDGVIKLGYRGGWLHPATGYSLPWAVVNAYALAHGDLRSARGAAETLASGWRRLQGEARFARLLNRGAFALMPPHKLRDWIYQPVCQLPDELLARFYGGRTNFADRLALLARTARITRPKAPTLCMEMPS